MRVYLEDFFKAFSYETADAEHLLQCFDCIQNHPQAKVLWDEALSAYEKNLNCDFEYILRIGRQVADLIDWHEYTVGLLLFCCLSRQLKVYYIQKEIDLEIYHNSMLDLRYKLEECKAVKGICGSFVCLWFPGFFELTRFSLGRLQFEIIPFGREYSENGKTLTADSKVINIHIPRTGTPLDVESCDQAFRQAKEFFAGQWSEPCTFHCHSWLLYPEHRSILPNYTNVYKFMDRFKILDIELDREGNDLWRLFDTDERNPDRLPTDSSMRRNYIAWLKQGKYTGCGIGIFFL